MSTFTQPRRAGSGRANFLVVSDTRPDPSNASRWFGIMAASIVPAAIVALLAIYALWPEFYLKHMLEAGRREQQVIEQITFGTALLAGALLLWAGLRFWRGPRLLGSAQYVARGAPGQQDRSGALLILVIALACIFFAGEEIDWGQHFFGWRTPQSYRTISAATNLHNAPGIPFRPVADLFLLIVFVLLPILWQLRLRDLPQFRGLEVAIPEAAVVSSIIIASMWRWLRRTYEWLIEAPPDTPSFHADFLEQINEQREMLTAIGLLIYAIYRVRLAFRIRSA